MPSVFELLEEIKRRPSMYLGWDSTERGKQLLGLEMLLHGYGHAVERHRIDDPGREILGALGEYLSKRYGWSMSCGAMAAIRETAGDDAHAWELFWKVLDEFKSSGRPNR